MFIHIIMKSIYNSNGLTQEDRLRRVEIIPNLFLLENSFQSLFFKAMQIASTIQIKKGDGIETTLDKIYRFQPFVVFNEILNINTIELELKFRDQCDKLQENKKNVIDKIISLISIIEDWRIRLEWVVLNDKRNYLLLNDLNDLITHGLKNYYNAFIDEYEPESTVKPIGFWFSKQRYYTNDFSSDVFLYRFYI